MKGDVVATAMGQLRDRMTGESPEIKTIMDRAKAGGITEAEAMKEMMDYIRQHPGLARKLLDHSKEALALLRQQSLDLSNLADLPVGGPMFHSGVGLPRINPLVDATIKERLQFDGDIPELRHGPMNPEATPALRINSKVRDPRVLGEMMRREALALGERVNAHYGRVLKNAEAERALMKPDAPLHPVFTGGNSDTDLPEYRRGEVPAPLVVQRAPEGSALARTQEEGRESLWRVVATTQGRESAVFVLQEMILEALRAIGLSVRLGDVEGVEVASYQWTMNLSGVPELQEQFNPVETAARVLTAGLAARTPAYSDEMWLHVKPVNRIADREVGWFARLSRLSAPSDDVVPMDQ